MEIPGINCLAIYAPHTQSGNIRFEFQGIQASFDASIIRLLVSMHRSWIVSAQEKESGGQAQYQQYIHADGTTTLILVLPILIIIITIIIITIIIIMEEVVMSLMTMSIVMMMMITAVILVKMKIVK